MVRMQDDNPYAPIIGVVGNVGEGSMRGEPRPTIFYSHRQLPLRPDVCSCERISLRQRLKR